MTLGMDLVAPAAPTIAAMHPVLWSVYRSALDRFGVLQDGLVARSLVRGTAGWTPTEPSPLNTAEVVRALFAIEANGSSHGSDARAMLRRLAADPACRSDVQVTALTLWAAAAGRDALADDIYGVLRARIEGVVARSVERRSDGFVVDHDVYSYQPARFMCAVLTSGARPVRQ